MPQMCVCLPCPPIASLASPPTLCVPASANPIHIHWATPTLPLLNPPDHITLCCALIIRVPSGRTPTINPTLLETLHCSLDAQDSPPTLLPRCCAAATPAVISLNLSWIIWTPL